MLLPKRTKHRKVRRGGKVTGVETRGTDISFGQYGIQALEHCMLTNRQIEAARISMTRKIKRGGKVWIRVFPDRPFTRKPAETRMGKGKGNHEGWAANIRAGRILFEMSGVDRELAFEALRVAAQKLPVRCKIVEAEEE